MRLFHFIKTALRNTGTRILLAIFVGIVVIIGYVVAYGYFTQINIYEEEELMKLDAIARTLALQIDGDEHSNLLNKYPAKDAISKLGQDSVYDAIFNILKNAKEANGLQTEIYTMVLNPDDSTIYFGVNTSDKTNFRHIYDDRPDMLLDSYQTGGTLPRYEDMYGVWLSAFAPVKNSQGQTVAVVQVDERFNDFIMRARNDVQRNILISLLIIGIIAFILFQSINNILDSEKSLQAEKKEVELLRKELVANVSHDLRTPVAVIHGYVETMKLKQKDISQEQRDRYIDIILQNTDKLRKLINELFELAKLEAAGSKIEAEPFQVAELIQDVAGKFRLLAEEKGITINTIPGKNIPHVHADIALIDRVLQNLMENAIKFCHRGDEITVQLQHRNNRVYVSVTDNGPGIDPEDLPHIFDRYHKGKNSQRDSSTGLGLAIVKKILDMHQSVLQAESGLGQGARFTFCLPVYTRK